MREYLDFTKLLLQPQVFGDDYGGTFAQFEPKAT